MAKNLLLICPTFLNQSETFIYAMLQKQKNFRQKIVCYDQRNPEVFPINNENIFVLRRLPFWQRIACELGWPRNQLFKFLKEEPDVIHAQFLPSAGLAGHIKKHFKSRPKLVLHVHGQDFFIPRQQKKWKYLRTNLSQAEIILTPSNYVKEQIQKQFPELKNVYCYYTAIDEENFPYRQRSALKKQVQLLMVGRMVAKKGFATAIKALSEVIRQDDQHAYLLNIVGHGPLKTELENLVKKLNLTNHVNFLTIKENDKVRELYKQSDLFLAPSETTLQGDQEGLPRTVTEALALGTPVIASRHSGLPEAIIDKQTGLLFEEKNSQECAEKILWAVKNWPEMVKYSRAGRKHFDEVFSGKRKQKLFKNFEPPLKDFLANLEG